MLWLTFKRVARSGFLNFWRQSLVSLASVLTLSAALFVIGSLFLGSIFLNATLEAIKEKVDISISLRTDAAETDIFDLKQALERLPGVKEVTHRSKDEELAIFREIHKDNRLVLQSLEEVGNPFGARLNVKALDPSYYEGIAAFLDREANISEQLGSIVDQVSFKKDIVDQLTAFIDASRKIGFAAGVVLVIISVLVVFNTISLTIYAARDEISVMRLVGANPGYVKGPFVVEGVIAGVLATILAMSLLYPAVLWVRDVTALVYGGINLMSFYIVNFATIFFLLLGSGIGLGVIGSLLAIRRYMK